MPWEIVGYIVLAVGAIVAVFAVAIASYTFESKVGMIKGLYQPDSVSKSSMSIKPYLISALVLVVAMLYAAVLWPFVDQWLVGLYLLTVIIAISVGSLVGFIANTNREGL